MKRVTVTLDLNALCHNAGVAKQHAPNSQCMAMIKGNAYGHGLVTVADTLENHVDAFGLAAIDGAVALRRANYNHRMLVAGGFCDKEDWQAIQAYQLDAVIHSHYQLDFLKNTPTLNTSVWIKVTTGMNRLGFFPEELPRVVETIQRANVFKEIVLMAHLSQADDPSASCTEEQIALFEKVSAPYGFKTSLANSGGVLGWPASHHDWIRPGIMLYGASPFQNRHGPSLNLLPVMELRATIMAIRPHKKGDLIGYGGTYRCSKDTNVGVVSIGYADGYPRHAKTGTPVQIRGKQCELIGRVSMDMITVDLSACPEASIGDDVLLWGKGLPAEIVAEHADTIAYSLFTGINPRTAHYIYR